MEQKNRSQIRKIIKLFFTMLYISAFTFGGGFVIVTLMKKKFVDDYKWLDEKEMLDITSIAQSTPGAIAVNAAVIVGKKIAGLPGIIAATLGTIIPPVVIITLLSFFYNEFSDNRYVSLVLKGLQAGVTAVILDVVFSLSSGYFKNKKIIDIIVIILSFSLVFFLKINVIFIILGAAAAGIISIFIRRKRVVKEE